MLYRIENLVKTRQGEQGYRLLVRRLQIGDKARIAITGPSGCGKSTCLDILGFGLKPDSATEFVFQPRGEQQLDVWQLWQQNAQNRLAALRLTQLGYVLQSGELLPYLTVGENMLFTARLAGIGQQEALETARSLALLLGIEKLWQAMPGTLSVGERQRAAIVRALSSRPKVILADEPTAALDPVHADKVMEAFLQALQKSDAALILVTHNAAWAVAGGLEQVPFQLEEGENGVTAILDYSAAGNGNA